MARNKTRVHNEYFQVVLRGNRKSCSHCKVKLPQGEVIYNWFEYHNVRHYSVRDFCVNCWHEVKADLLKHSGPCGCTFQLNAYHCILPTWLTLDEKESVI